MKIYSATQFFNELDLLEIRLETLDPVVDWFIISESRYTHSGKEKPLYYDENKGRFSKFHHKIIHQIVEHTPSTIEELWVKPKNDLEKQAYQNVLSADWFDKNVPSYVRDTFEKEILLKAMSYCDPLDIILLGDLDEIPSPEVVAWLKKNIERHTIYNLQHDMFYYYFNCQKKNEPWLGTIAVQFEELQKTSFCKMRTYRTGKIIQNAGWHFTYMGGVNRIRQKIESWGEQSLNTDSVKDKILENVKNPFGCDHDLFFRPAEFVLRDINDGTYPKYIVKNQEKYADYIWRENG